MKIRSEDLILETKIKLENNAYYISGNDESYIKKIESIIAYHLKNRGFGSKKYITDAAEYDKSADLFFASEIIILDGLKNANKKFIEEIEENKDALIITAKNKPGDTGLKRLFEKDKKLSLVMCYELSRELKIKLLNFYINNNDTKIDKDAYWHLLDIADNRFVFFEKEIKKLLLIKKNNIDISLIRKTLSIQDSKNFEKLFFALLLKNKSIVDIYNSLISNPADLQFFLQRTKFFIEIIIFSDSIKEAEDRFPKYLFKEKSSFLKIYKSTNKSSLKKIIELLYKTERVVRKNTSLYKPIGFIFVLRLKKIMFSA